MHDQTTYRGLRFERRVGLVTRRVIAVGGALIIFTLIWWLVPTKALYWLLTPLTLVLVWAATYGWRQALANLIQFLKNLEDL